MDFDKVLNTTSPKSKNDFTLQALKRQEYNRQYQAKLRERAKLITLEKKVDNNLNYVIGYIKRKYLDEFDNYVEQPVDTEQPKLEQVITYPAFDDWLLLSGASYPSIEDAYERAGLAKEINIKKFTKLFSQYFKQNNKGRYVKA